MTGSTLAHAQAHTHAHTRTRTCIDMLTLKSNMEYTRHTLLLVPCNIYLVMRAAAAAVAVFSSHLHKCIILHKQTSLSLFLPLTHIRTHTTCLDRVRFYLFAICLASRGRTFCCRSRFSCCCFCNCCRCAVDRPPAPHARTMSYKSWRLTDSRLAAAAASCPGLRC